jgi:chromosome segregation ATPase
VQNRALVKHSLETKIQEYRRKILELRESKAAEELKVKKVQNDIADIDEEMAKLTVIIEETKKRLEPVKVRDQCCLNVLPKLLVVMSSRTVANASTKL